MSKEPTILVNGQPVEPTSLWRALLPLVWLCLGFAALGFFSALAVRITVWVWLIPATAACIWWLGAIHTQRSQAVGILKRLRLWLRVEWAIARKKVNCPHAGADPHWQHPCPDCGYDALFESVC